MRMNIRLQKTYHKQNVKWGDLRFAIATGQHSQGSVVGTRQKIFCLETKVVVTFHLTQQSRPAAWSISFILFFSCRVNHRKYFGATFHLSSDLIKVSSVCKLHCMHDEHLLFLVFSSWESFICICDHDMIIRRPFSNVVQVVICVYVIIFVLLQ